MFSVLGLDNEWLENATEMRGCYEDRNYRKKNTYGTHIDFLKK